MSQTEPAAQQEYNVEYPDEMRVYYDTVLDTVVTVHAIEENFVTYVVEGEVDNVHSDSMEKFLAWLAARRFVKLGRRDCQGKLQTSRDDMDRVFKEVYGVGLRDYDPYEIGQTIFEQRLGERMQFEDRE